MTELLYIFGTLLLGAIGVYFHQQANRRDAARSRREGEEASHAGVRVRAYYLDGRIVIFNTGPSDAERVRVVGVKCGPRSRRKGRDLLAKWAEPFDLPVGAERVLTLRSREEVGDWIEVALEWDDQHPEGGTRTERLNWAG